MSGFRQLTNRSYDISDTLYLYIGYDKLLSVGIIFIVPSLVQRFPLSDYWHCRMSSMSSVRPSLPAAHHCCGFAAVGPTSRRYRSIAAQCLAAAKPQHGTQQQMWAVPRCQLT